MEADDTKPAAAAPSPSKEDDKMDVDANDVLDEDDAATAVQSVKKRVVLESDDEE